MRTLGVVPARFGVVPARARFLLLTLAFLFSAKAFAAACCGGAVSAPAVITSDLKYQTSVQSSFSSVIGTSRSDGTAVFRRSNNDENEVVLRFIGAAQLSERIQAHLEIPASRRARQIDAAASSDWGLQDIKFGGAFELVPERYYSAWKPRVFLFADGIFPTGGSAFTSLDPLGSDIHSKGAWGATAGTLMVKQWGSIDANFTFSRTEFLERNGIRLGAITALNLQMGYSPRFLEQKARLGLGVGPTWEASATGQSNTLNSANQSSRLSWTASLQASYTPDEIWAVSASYFDQTLLGPTYNALLSRGASLLLTRRFDL